MNVSNISGNLAKDPEIRQTGTGGLHTTGNRTSVMTIIDIVILRSFYSSFSFL